MNKVCVKGQRIYFYRSPEPIPKSQVNFSKIEFDMDETWSSFLSVVAQFIQNGEPKNVQVEDGYCFVPSGLEIGAFELCLRGDDGESVVASVNRLTFEVCEGFDPSGETPLPPSPDLYTQLIKEIDSGKKIAQSVREDADSGKFNGERGADGGWYTPSVTQTDKNTLRMAFSPSKEGMPVVAHTDITLPGGGGGSTIELDTTLTQSGQAADAAAVGNRLSSLSEEIADLLPPVFKPDGISYLTFSSRNSFSLRVVKKTWDGALEYFASNKTWTVWDGTSSLSSEANGSEYVLYLRGTGNTVIIGYDDEGELSWNLEGFDISCIGNIETLLDYATVESGEHPVMADYCYNGMFSGCISLTQAPELPATTLAKGCYSYMFSGCTGLTRAPELPATTLASGCYGSMFYLCTGLTQVPELPATTLARDCYGSMFGSCTSLTRAPELPAITLADYCYFNMFSGCTSLTQVPELPATTLADHCYTAMFGSCTSLTRAPELPATTLASSCYIDMFNGCISLTQVPKLPATTLANYCYFNMFLNCTSLTRAPELPAITLAANCYGSMFNGCISLTQVPELPATTLAANCYQGMFYRCTSLKLSETKTEEYTQEYRIPLSGNGTDASAALAEMFISTGGTFTGTPALNTTYYLSSDNMIVRGNDIANLNGYVKSMIDNAGECIPAPATAQVGQVLVVKAVDANGKPTEWEAADMASGADGKSAYAYAVESGYTGTEAEFAAKLAAEMPDKLPNPNALTFTGAVTGSYDGSAPLSVEIPSGGGSGENWRLVNTVTTTEDVSNITITQDSDGNAFSLKKVKVVGRVRGNSSSLKNWIRVTANNRASDFCCDWVSGFAAAAGQDYYYTNRTDFSVCGNALFAEMNLSSLNNAASKGVLVYSNKTLSWNSHLDGITSITSLRIFSSDSAIGAGTEIYVYGVDA